MSCGREGVEWDGRLRERADWGMGGVSGGRITCNMERAVTRTAQAEGLGEVSGRPA
jgi:hypothetical protein